MKRWSMSILKILVVIFLVGTAIMLGINFYVVRSAKDRLVTKGHTDSTIHADCILVLGAGIRADGSPTPMLKDRLDTAIEVYKSGAAPKLLMSGDHSREDYDEVQTMKDYAIDKGVPSEDIFMDHAGFSTYESLYRARDIFQAQNIVIVPQKYHLYRALSTAEALSLQALGVPADTKTYGGQTYRDLREILARNKDFLTSIYKPKPTYLGDTIPVNGNGNITND